MSLEYTELNSAPQINGWREAVNLSVVDQERPWNLTDLEIILRQSIAAVTRQNLQENQGQIFTTLSGGVDSSLCLAIIAELCFPQTPIHTFTAGGSIKHPDIQFARIVSSLFQTIHHEIIVGAQSKSDLEAEFRDFRGHTEQTKEEIKRGDINIWAVYQEIHCQGAKSVIVHDGIDELIGGYWPHCSSFELGPQAQQKEFEKFWSLLVPEHLEPLERTADYFKISLLYPYLQTDLVKYISHIPTKDRASLILDKKGINYPDRKKPLRALARQYFGNVPGLKDIPDRKKRGFVDALLAV